jgi:hypothetical protein
MKNITRHTGTLEIIERLKNSYNGNPRYLCRIDGYTFRTKPNSSYAYTLPNHSGKVITVTLGTYYGRLALNSIEKG